MMGATIDGFSTALNLEITVKDGRVEQSNFPDYPLLRMAAAPDVEVHLVGSQFPPSGAGEMECPPSPPRWSTPFLPRAASGSAVFRSAINSRGRERPTHIHVLGHRRHRILEAAGAIEQDHPIGRAYLAAGGRLQVRGVGRRALGLRSRPSCDPTCCRADSMAESGTASPKPPAARDRRASSRSKSRRAPWGRRYAAAIGRGASRRGV